MNKTVEVVNKYSGEIYTFHWENEVEQAQAYKQLGETIDALVRAKNKIRDDILKNIDGQRQIVGAFEWSVQVRRYMNYDLTVMRNVLDEDYYNQLVKPDKIKIDLAIKETIFDPEKGNMTLDATQALRDSMIEERLPSTALRLDKIILPLK